MSISFAVALAGTVLAAVGTGLAIRLCVRKPRADMVAWVLALAGLTVALAAQAAGYRRGFVPTTFRATQLGGALVAPLALAWGMSELAARGLVARFAGRLCLAGLFVVAAVILATDVLSARGFTQQWPAPRDHFQYVSLSLLALVAVAVAATVVVALITTGLRSRAISPPGGGRSPRSRWPRWPRWPPRGCWPSCPRTRPTRGLTLVAAVAAWLAASRAAKVSLGRLPQWVQPPRQPAGRPLIPATAATTRWTCTAMATGTSTTARPSPRTSTASTTDRRLPAQAGATAPPGTGARGSSAAGYGRRGRTQPRRVRGRRRTRAASRPGATQARAASRQRTPAAFTPIRSNRSTGAFDPLFRPNGSSAPGRDPAGRDAPAWPRPERRGQPRA